MDATTYISIDVATRSLAIGVYQMRSFSNLSHHAPTDPVELNTYLDSLLVPRVMNVYDINGGAKVKETTGAAKAAALKSVLLTLDEELSSFLQNSPRRDVIVLIEYQMNANHGANAIFNMIVYHYADRYPVEVIKPSWKNTIALHPALTLSTFLGSCSSNYQANKSHTRANMLYFLSMIDCMDLLSQIKKCNYDDIADTLMQAIAYHKKSNR